jgi:hypothetical protein
VLVVRARVGAARTASLFDEIYGAQRAELPASVTEALVALSSARRSRRARLEVRLTC